MGFRATWIAIPAAESSDVLTRLDLRETKQKDETNDAPFSGALVAGDWYIIFSNEPTFADDLGAATLSNIERLIICTIDETSMVSISSEYRNGSKLWSIEHDAQIGDLHLEVQGAPPKALKPIRETFLKQQKSQDETGLLVDFLFEVPIELAANITGYRHDRVNFDWGAPDFKALAPVGSSSVRGKDADIDRRLFDKISSIVSTANFTQTMETRFERELDDFSVVIEFTGTIRKTHFHLCPFLYIAFADQRYQINLALIGVRFKIDRANMISTYRSGDNRAEYCVVFDDVFRALTTLILPKLTTLQAIEVHSYLLDLGLWPERSM